MHRRMFVFVTMVFLLSFLPGCWSRNEIENLAIVGGVGIDKIKENGREKFLMTFNIIRPSLAGGGTESGGAKGKPIFWRMTSVGETMADAERNLQLRVPRRVFYGQARYVIIGEETARESIMDIIDYIQRHKDIRLRTLILVSRGRASEQMIRYPETENTISREIQGEEATGSIRVSKVKIEDVAQITDKLITPGSDPVIAQVKMQDSPPAEPGGSPVPALSFEGGGVIKVDQLVGWLDGPQTRGYLLGTGKAAQSAIPVSFKKHGSKDLSIILTKSSCETKVDVKDGEVSAVLKIRAEGDIGENHEDYGITTREDVNRLEKYLKEAIQKEVSGAVEAARKLDADIFSFGDILHRSSPAKWKSVEKEWYSLLPQIKVTVDVKADIRRTGFISESYKAR